MGKDTCSVQNIVKTRFKSLGWWISTGLCITGLLLFSNEVLSISPFVENFNSYDYGNLSGQGGWVDFGLPDDFQVVDEYTYEGLKSVSCFPAEQCADKKQGTPIPTGEISYFIKMEQPLIAGRIEDIQLRIFDSDDKIFSVWVRSYYDEVLIGYFFEINYKPIDAEPFVPIDTIAWFNGWLEINVEWDYSTQKFRIGSFGENWSAWLNTIDNISFVAIDEVGIISSLGDSFRYVDSISVVPICELGSCNLCETFDTCVEADCEWFFSIFLQDYFCVEPTPQPELCGPFYECQYCENQFTCEEDKIGFCEWVDRGLGESCFMVEPTIPPEQEWEVPDLEDCALLTGVEMWLCEIKNDVLGVFMPSQEKINDLYLTMGLLKDRFPFNYVESLKTFFADISVSFDEEKSIPIKILGQESEVSFEFWDQETEIGGIGETFKNVLFDFTTFIILMGFFVWLISLIRRFF